MTDNPLDDARLVHFAIPNSGWAGNRVRLSENDIPALRNLIRRPLLEDVEGVFDALLQQIFTAAVQSEMFWRRLRKEGGNPHSVNLIAPPFGSIVAQSSGHSFRKSCEC